MSDDEEVQRVLEALDAVDRIEDPEARVRARNKVLAEQSRRSREWQKERRELVLAMRAEKVPFRKIAERLELSLATVQDIVRGYSGSGKNRPRKQTEGQQDDGQQ